MRRCWAIGLAMLIGCNESSDPSRYVPPADRATAALETALHGWMDGAPGGPVPGADKPVVEFVDSHRPAGKKLTSFAIVSQIPGDGPREFIVKLTLYGANDEQKVRYIVYGIDPIWVVRQEDYVMLNHWTHSPTTSSGAKGK